MTGQLNIFDFMSREAPSMNEPGVYSRSGRQHITLDLKGNETVVSIWTDSEAMICRVDTEELRRYFDGIFEDSGSRHRNDCADRDWHPRELHTHSGDQSADWKG